MKTLKIQTLNTALQYWEDANLYGELMFHSRLSNFNPSAALYVPLPGSEITEIGWLARKIENFESLKKELKMGVVKDPSVYLPRIPKQYKGDYTDQYTFCENQSHFFVELPSHLSSWMKTKKVCRLTQEAEIPQIPLSESYLHLLPYDSFVLYLNDPFVFDMADLELNLPGYTEYFSTIVVSRKDNKIFAYAIADGLENFCMEPVERKYVLEAIHYAKQKKQKSYQQAMKKIFAKRRDPSSSIGATERFEKLISGDGNVKLTEEDMQRPYNFTGRGVAGFFNTSIEIPKQKELTKKSFFDGVKDSVLGLFKKDTVKPEGGSTKNKQPFFEILPEFINGFCKLLSEAGSSTPIIGVEVENIVSKKVAVGNEKKNIPAERLEIDWCDVPLGNVLDLRIEENGGGNVRSYTSIASEKAAHVRRGHFRKYIQSNGSIKSVWIEQVVVRKDKMEKDQIRSGVMTI